MQKSNKRKLKINFVQFILPLLFFLIYFVVVFAVVEPTLLYHGGSTITNFPVFFTTSEFLRENLEHLGGPGKYLYSFIAQFLYFNSLGAALITIQGFLFFLCLKRISEKLKFSFLKILGYFGALIMLFLYNHYTFHYAAFNTIIISLGLFCLYLQVPLKGKIIFFAVALSAFYYICDGGILYWALMCIFYEILFNKKYQMAFIYFLICIVVPYLIGICGFGLSIKAAYTDMTAFSWKILMFSDRSKMIYGVHLLYCLGISTIIFAWLGNKIKNIAHRKTGKTKQQNNRVKGWNFYKKEVVTALTLGVLLTGVSVCYDKKQKAFFAVDYYSYHKKWDKVLRFAKQLPNNFFAVHHATRALYHNGKFYENMFNYTQHPDALLFTDNTTLATGLTIFDTYIDLGIINLAEHYLSRNISRLGERDIFLERLAWINMIKGNTETAKTFLNALSNTLFRKNWALKQLSSLKENPNLGDNKEIQIARANMLKKDRSMSQITKEEFLMYLLEANPKNKMAFDYLMGWYLITKNTGEFVKNLDKLKTFGYANLPFVCEQAILMHIYSTKKDINMCGFKITPKTIEYAKGFYSLLNENAGNEKIILQALEEKYGDNYLYYFVRKFKWMPKFSGRLK